MNILLWIFQIALALFCFAGGQYKLFHFDELTKMPQTAALTRAGWGAIGIFEMLCAVLLVVPAAVKWMPILTPIAAAALAIESVALAVLFAQYSLALSSTNPLIYVVVMGLVAAFVAYGRHVLGSDGAGTVEEVGDDVHDLKAGDRVYGISFLNPKGGFYAEYAVIKANNVAMIPPALSTRDAGALAVDGVTALDGLDKTLQLKAGESILILGASGGVGHLAVQLAKRMRARVLAVASGQDGVEFVKGLGADKVIDGHREDILKAAHEFAPKGLDAALLMVGGKAAEQAVTALRKGGRAAHPNGVPDAPQERDGVKIVSYNAEPNQQTFAKLNQLIDGGPFEVHIARTFRLEDAATAQQALSAHYLGKLALVLS